MKFVTSLTFALAATLGASAFAADKASADTLTPQQQRMSDCSKGAHEKSLKGDEYKSYMSTCMKAAPATVDKTAPAAATTADAAKPASAKTSDSQWVAAPGSANPQQQKMKTCAADAKAKGLKGADRRTYMSTCLKTDSTTKPAAAKPAATKPAPAK